MDAIIVTVHELGHKIEIPGSLPPGQMMRNFLQAVGTQQRPTWYGSRNKYEWFAEAFTVAIMGSDYTNRIPHSRREAPYLHGLSQPYVDFFSQYFTVSPTTPIR